MLHVCSYDEFYNPKTGAYAKFMNQQIKNAFNDIPTENLSRAINSVEQIIKQTEIENGLISTSKTKEQL